MAALNVLALYDMISFWDSSSAPESSEGSQKYFGGLILHYSYRCIALVAAHVNRYIYIYTLEVSFLVLRNTKDLRSKHL